MRDRGVDRTGVNAWTRLAAPTLGLPTDWIQSGRWQNQADSARRAIRFRIQQKLNIRVDGIPANRDRAVGRAQSKDPWDEGYALAGSDT